MAIALSDHRARSDSLKAGGRQADGPIPALGALPAAGPKQGEAIRAVSCWIDRTQNGRRRPDWAKISHSFL
jgi:hypothetical protein